MHAVIPCRRGPNEELRYALRSIATHCPWVADVSVYGEPPDWYTGRRVHVEQGPNRYDNTTRALEAVATDRALPDVVVLWNDDFYATTPTDHSPDANLGPLAQRINPVVRRHHAGGTSHQRGAYTTLLALQAAGHPDPLDWDVHAPMTLDREGLTRTLAFVADTRAGHTHKRTVYGTLAGLTGPTWEHDVKVRRRGEPWPGGPWLSTSDATYRLLAGRLHVLLPEPSPWER